MLRSKKCKAVIFVLLFLMGMLFQVSAQSSGVIDTAARFQTMEGIGAAIAWYNNWLTEHPNKLELYDVLFQDTGLDILRIRNTYRYSTPFDEGNEEIVEYAGLSLGEPIIVYISSWSPPADLKSNGSTEGTGGTLLQSGGEFVYDQFAQYWYDSLTAYAELGIEPKYISIQNEPDYTATWESCVFEEEESSTYPGYGIALDAVYNKLQEMANPPGLIGAETTGIGTSLVQNYAAQINLDQLYGVAYHLYNGGDAYNPDSFNTALQQVRDDFPDMRKFQTEYDGGDHFNTAQLIHNCIVEGDVVAYIFWELIWEYTNGKCMVVLENPQTPDAWTTAGGYTLTDNYYYVKHYAKYIDPGFVRVDASVESSNIKISAFISPDEDQLTAVLINEGDAEESVTLDVGSFSIGDSEVYLTGGDSKFESLGSLDSGNVLTMPAQSVVTVLFNSPAFVPTVEPPPLPTPEPPPESRSAFEQIEAETFNDQYGILTEACGDVDGGRAVAYIENGDWIKFSNVDFQTGAVEMQARASSNGSGGTIEIYLGGLNGVLAGTIDVTLTGAWQTYETFTAALENTIGVNDLYLVFSGADGYLFNLNWISLTAGEVDPTVEPTPSPTPSSTPTPGNDTGGLRVRYMCSDTADETTQIKPYLEVVNGQAETISLNELKIRYYYTKEGSASQEFSVDYAVIGSDYVTGVFFDGYVEIGFTSAAGVLVAGTTTGQIQARLNKSDWTAYDQTDDYSFSPSITSLTDYEKITVYLNDELVWGTPEGDVNTTPSPTPEETPTPTPSPTPVEGLPGDVNEDGSITIVDALMTAQYYVGLDPSGFNADYADVNCDGAVTIVDALIIAQYYVGLVSEFC